MYPSDHGLLIEPGDDFGEWVAEVPSTVHVGDQLISGHRRFVIKEIRNGKATLEETGDVSNSKRIADLQEEVRCKDAELAGAFERARKYAAEIGQYREEIEGLKMQLANTPPVEASADVGKKEEPEKMATPVGPLSLGAAFAQLTSEHGKQGMKIGGSAFVAKRIVSATQKVLKKTLGKRKAAKYVTLMETKLGQKVTAAVVPGIIYVAARMYPNRVPKAATVGAIAGYAFTGSIASLTELGLSKMGPVFKAVATLADDLPEEIMDEVKNAPTWGKEQKEARA